jgi:hypothetical protein
MSERQTFRNEVGLMPQEKVGAVEKESDVSEDILI